MLALANPSLYYVPKHFHKSGILYKGRSDGLTHRWSDAPLVRRENGFRGLYAWSSPWVRTLHGVALRGRTLWVQQNSRTNRTGLSYVAQMV